MSNDLSKLNDALFDQLDRLNNAELTGDALETELKRTQSVTSVSKEIVANARLILDADKHRSEFGSHYKLPELLENKAGRQ